MHPDSTPAAGLAGLKHWRHDAAAGLQVALLWTPFSLGVALASGAPAISCHFRRCRVSGQREGGGQDRPLAAQVGCQQDAAQYGSRIFGAKNFRVVDHVERLPEKLPMLYKGLTRC